MANVSFIIIKKFCDFQFSNVNFQTLHDVSNQAALTVEEDKYGNLGMVMFI